MALNAEIVTVTQPGSTGQQTYSLPTGFDAKAIIAWTVLRTADGAGSANLNFCYGVGTYRSSTVVQRCVTIQSQDNVGTSNTSGGLINGASLLRTGDGTSTTIDFEIDLISLNANDFVLDWVNLSTTASVQVVCVLIGGSDVEDALVGEITTQTTPADHDITVATGFGQPSAVLFACRGTSGGTGLAAAARLGLGFGLKSGSANARSYAFSSANSAATQDVGQYWDEANMRDAFGNTSRNVFKLAASSAWPTDGFRITYTTQTSAIAVAYLALKLSSNVTATAGTGAAPTAAAPQTTTLTSANTPKLALLWALRATADSAGTFDSTGANVSMFGVGAIDSANREAFLGGWDDDAQATASVSGTVQSTSKAISYYDPPTDTLTSEADGAVNGTNFDLTWGDTDASAFKYHYLTLGVASTATTALAENAAGTGAGNAAAPSVTVAAGNAAATGAANDPDGAVRMFLTATTSSQTTSAATGSWDDTTGDGKFVLGTAPAGTAEQVARTETNASADYDVLLGTWVSAPVTRQGAIDTGAAWNITVARKSSLAGSNLRPRLRWYVIDSSGTLQGSSLTNVSVTSLIFTEGVPTGMSINTTVSTGRTVNVGERLVLEVGFRHEAADATSVTGEVWAGGTSSTHLTAADTDTTHPGHVTLPVAHLFAEGTAAIAENAAGTGAANQAAPKVTVNAENAAGTGAANQPAVTVSDTQPAENAAGTGAANQAAVGVAAAAFPALGTGTADNAAPHVAPVAGNAAGTAAANQAGISTTDVAPAEAATATGAANNAAPKVTPNAAPVAVTGAAANAVTSLAPVAGNAAGTGAANQPAVHVAPVAATGTGTGTAVNPSVSTGGAAANASAGIATATGAADNAPAKIAVDSPTGIGSGTGVANNAAVSISRTAPAEAAAGTGAASQPTTAVATNAGAAAGTGAVGNAVPVVAAAPQSPGQGTGTANGPSAAVVVSAGSATATGAANNATAVTLAAGTAAAGNAAGSGAANNATAVVSAVTATGLAGVAGGDGAALNASVLVVSAGAGRGWYSLLRILQEARDPQFTQPRGQSCPNDGEPFRTGPRGELFCPFDGYHPARDRM